MRATDLIKKKRDGGRLEAGEIDFFIGGLTGGSIPEYQASALLMAVCIRGLDEEETLALTGAMVRSGRTLDLSGIPGVAVDKHSTGGVGDKTSLILVPTLAAMGLKVPMIAGRGLGHTGGTIDKIESIPGLRTDLSPGELVEQIGEIGCAISGQTSEVAPADRALYALRDATATVESIPLIAASIMSKKLSEGIGGLVLDVKCGRGALLPEIDQARALARLMVRIGKDSGVRTVALVTNMNQPLGRTVGSALEVKECITAMKGSGRLTDLMDLTLTLAAWCLYVGDSLSEEVEAFEKMSSFALGHYRREILDFIEKGDVFQRFLAMVERQGGDPEAVLRIAQLPTARVVQPLLAPRGGFLHRIDARAAGRAAAVLGAGRERAGEAIDHAAGLVLSAKVGDEVAEGAPLLMMHTSDEARIAEAREILMAGIEIGDRDPAPEPLIHEVII